MSESLFELLQPAEGGAPNRIYGVVTGVVTNNQDDEGLGRVKVKFPWLSDSDESWWARIAAPMASKAYGAFFLPEVDDEVLVAFEQGDINYPYVLGALWNTSHQPPQTNADGENNIRSITSRSGMVLSLDDTAGGEKITIGDQEGKNLIVLDVANQTISISAEADITLESKTGKVQIKGSGVELISDAAVKVEAGSSMDLKASGQMTIKGATVNIN